MLSPEYQVALTRGLVTGVIGAGIAFFAVVGTGGAEAAGIAAGAAFFTALGGRFGVEGTIDSRRANRP